MKVATILGTRPEIIRLSLIIRKVDRHAEQILIHTGQNFDPLLRDIFLSELGVRAIDVDLAVGARRLWSQIGEMIALLGNAFETHRPDRVLILGDTNSGLAAAIVAARMGLPVFHVEAGNRAYDDRIPEEVNRRVIDHCSTVLLPYTQRSKENLEREGIELERIFVTGNPIFEVIDSFAGAIDNSDVLSRLGLEPQRFLLATVHRAENVDDPGRLRKIFEGLARVSADQRLPLVAPIHPRTAGKLRETGMTFPESMRLIDALGFFDFVRLEKTARLVLSDSGTVQEECCIFGVPTVTLRDVTERPETIECGSNILTGADPEDIVRLSRVALDRAGGWTPPADYLRKDVSDTIARVLLGYTSFRRR